MKFSKLIIGAGCLFLLAGCEFKCSVGNTGPSKKEIQDTTKSTGVTGAIIRNDVELEVTGVKLKEAYLVDETNTPLPANEARLGQKIYLVLKLDTGWVKENNLSYLGASERISSEDGRVIADAPDIFKAYDETGISPVDAKQVSLSAIITRASSSGDEYTVQFRVWDKRGSGEVRGRYKFKLLQ